jgi:hypothetical protein
MSRRPSSSTVLVIAASAAGRVGQVGCDRQSRSPRLNDLGGKLFESVSAACHQHNRGAKVGKAEGRCATDAA